MADAATHRHPDLSVDQRSALRAAAVRLAAEFDGVHGRETVERFLRLSYEQFAAPGTLPHFLPLLAERFARQRLRALAGTDSAGAGTVAPPDRSRPRTR